eukprot:Opistho-2@27475
MNKRLYLIPVSLDEETPITTTLPNDAIDVIKRLTVFIVENEKTARAYLKKVGILTPQKDLTIVLHSKKDRLPINQYFKLFETADEIGLMSEAGYPGIADPGADVI